MVDVQNGFQWIGRIYPFPDAPDQYIRVLFSRVPLDTPYLGFPTIFNVRQWDRLEFTGRTPLGTDQNSYQPVLGAVPFTPPHAPQGNPALWLNGFSYADWMAGRLGGTNCCNLCEQTGGGSGGGAFDFQLLPQPNLVYLVTHWINGVPHTTGFFTAFWTVFSSPPQAEWLSAINPTELPPIQIPAYVVITGSIYNPPALDASFYDPQHVFSVGSGPTYFVTYNPFYIVQSLEIGGAPRWNDYELIMAPMPVFPMSQGGSGGGQFYWRDQWSMEGGGAGGDTFGFPAVPEIIMGLGGKGGDSWPFSFPPTQFMGIGGKGGGQWFFWRNFYMVGGVKGGGPTTITTKPVVMSGSGGGGGGSMPILIRPIVDGMGGTGGGGAFTITP